MREDIEADLIEAIYESRHRDDVRVSAVMVDALFLIRRYRWARANRLRLHRKGGVTV